MKDSETLSDWRDYVAGRSKRHGLDPVLAQLPRSLRKRFDLTDSPAVLKKSLEGHNEFIDRLRPLMKSIKQLDPEERGKAIEAVHALYDAPTDSGVHANRDVASIVLPLAWNHPDRVEGALEHLAKKIRGEVNVQGGPKGVDEAERLHSGWITRLTKEHLGRIGTHNDLFYIPQEEGYFDALPGEARKLYHKARMRKFLKEIGHITKNKIPTHMAQPLRDLLD